MAWKNVEGEEKAGIVQSVTWAQPAFRRDPARLAVDMLELPFYPGGQLLRLTTQELPGKPLWHVRLPQKVETLERKADSIHHCNILAPLMLNDKNIYDYLKFWYYFTEGSRVFESKVKRSAVGYSGKVWLFEQEIFFEADVNVNPHGLVTLLDKEEMPDVPDFKVGDFDLPAQP